MSRLVKQIVQKHIKSYDYDYQRWQDETESATGSEQGAVDMTIETTGDANANATFASTGLAAELTMTLDSGAAGSAAGIETDSPSKLNKMWKRVKRAFGGGGRHHRHHHSMTNAVSETDIVDVTVGSAEAGRALRVKPGRTLPKVDLPYIYCGRYTNPGYILRHYVANHVQPQIDVSGQTYNAIINSDIQELDGRVKVQAWVAHLANPTTGSLTREYIASSSSSSSPSST